MNDVGIFLSRVAVGAGIAAHGAQKAFGSFEGPGPTGAAALLEGLGFIPGSRFAAAASWTELASGSLIVLGLGGPAGPAALISTMVVAQTSVHAKNGFFAQKNGVELGVLYAAGALALASAGYGRFSLDETFGWKKLREPWLGTVAILGGIAAGIVILRARAIPPESTPEQTPGNRVVETTRNDAVAAKPEHATLSEGTAAADGSLTPPA